MIVNCIIVSVCLMVGAALASAVINILCEEERETQTVYGEVMDDAEQ